MGQWLRKVMDVESENGDVPEKQDPNAEVFFGDWDIDTGKYEIFYHDRLTLDLELGRQLAKAFGSLKEFEVCL